MEYVIYDFNEIIRQISGDVKGLILVNKTAATNSVVFIQDYINQNRKSIETFDANKELLDQAEDNHIDYLEANKDEAEARKKAGLIKMVTGAGEIALIGLPVLATAGAAAPVATIVMLGKYDRGALGMEYEYLLKNNYIWNETTMTMKPR